MRRLAAILLCLLASSAGATERKYWESDQSADGFKFFTELAGTPCVTKATVTHGQLTCAAAGTDFEGPLTVGNESVRVPPGHGGLTITGPATAPVMNGQVFEIDAGKPLGGSSDDAPTIQAAINALPASGGIVRLRPGTYRIRSQVSTNGSTGVRLMGHGAGVTTVLVDDAGLAGADAFLFTNTWNGGVSYVTFSAVTPRTSGSYVTVAGGNAAVPLPAFGISSAFFHMDDVDMDSGFNGLWVKDSAAHVGALGVYVNRGLWRNFSAGGSGVWFDSLGTTNGYPNGASFFVNNVWFMGPAVPLANTVAVHISGTSDFTLQNVETWGFENGLLIDPPTGTAVFSGHIQDCYFDFAHGDVASVTAAFGGQIKWLDIVHTWFAGSQIGAGLKVNGATEVQVTGSSRSFANATRGFYFVGVDQLVVADTQSDGNGTNDISIAGNTSHFSITGNEAHSTAANGIQIDNGSNHGTVSGNDTSNTAIGIVNNATATDMAVNENTGTFLYQGTPFVQDPNQFAYYVVTRPDNKTTNSVDLGTLASGTLTVNVSGGIATIKTEQFFGVPPIYVSTVIGSPDPSNIAAWYEGDVGVTLSGSDVTAWADQSGHGFNVSAGGANPTYTASSINGHAGVNFSGVNKILQETSANVLTSGHDRYIFAVVKPATGAGGLFGAGGPIAVFRVTTPQFIGLLGNAFTNTYVYSTGTVGDILATPISNPTLSSNNYLVEIAGVAGSAPVVYLNGIIQTLTVATNVVSETGSTGFAIGNDPLDLTQFFDGDIDELLVLDTVPIATVVARNRGYFASKYNLAVSGIAEGIVISEQGAIVSGSTSTAAQNLGGISTAILACSTTAGVCTVDGVTVGGGLTFNTGTATLTDASFSCSANQFVSSSSTSGLACTQPAFSNLSGSATCAQLPALTGDVTSSAGTCGTTLANFGSPATYGGAGQYIEEIVTDVKGRVQFVQPRDYFGLTAELKYYVEQTNGQITAYAGGTAYLSTSSQAASTTSIIEYPSNGAVPTFGQIYINLISNTITAGTLTIDVSRNGFTGGGPGTAIALTSGSATGYHAGGITSVGGGGSVSDLLGIVLSPSLTIALSGPLQIAITYRLAGITF